MLQNRIRYTTLISLLWGFIGLKAFGIWSYILQLQLLNHPPFPIALALANDLRVRLVAILVLLIYIVAAVFFCRWVYVSNKTVRELGASGLRHSPAMAVGSFFIPFANLVWPYEAMSDLWRASIDVNTWQQNRKSLALPFWWAFWILNGALGYLAFFLTREAKTVDSLRDLTTYLIGTEFVGITVTLLAIYLVRSISIQANTQFCANQPPLPTQRSDTPAAGAPVVPPSDGAGL